MMTAFVGRRASRPQAYLSSFVEEMLLLFRYLLLPWGVVVVAVVSVLTAQSQTIPHALRYPNGRRHLEEKLKCGLLATYKAAPNVEYCMMLCSW